MQQNPARIIIISGTTENWRDLMLCEARFQSNHFYHYHQFRHTHAIELINGGVSFPTIHKRLGHKNLQTTLRSAEQSDATADAELRAWRRQHPSSW